MIDTIRFATFLAPSMRPVYQFIADYAAQKLGCPTELIVGSSFDQFAWGQADVGFICGLPYVDLMRQSEPAIELLAAPVLQGERYQDRPIYFSDVIVQRDSPFTSFADLRRHSWAYNDRDSQSGYNVVRYHLAKIGASDGYFSNVIQAGFHQKSIQKVAAGEVDASAIDAQVLAIELRDHPELVDQVRIIDMLGPSTIQPVVAARRLPDTLKADLRAVLLAMGDDPTTTSAFAHGFVKCFAPVTDATYDDIREMSALAQNVTL